MLGFTPLASAPIGDDGVSLQETIIDVGSVGVSLQALSPEVFTGVSVSVPSVDTVVSAVAPAIGLDVLVSVPQADLQIVQYQPTVFVGASVLPPSANLNIAPLAPTIDSGIAFVVPTVVVVIAGQAPRGVGNVGGRRYVSITSDTSANAVVVESFNNAEINNTDNGVVIDGLYNQAV